MTLSRSGFSPRPLLLAAAAGFGLSLLSALPASAHGFAGHGLMAGFVHPLTGLDHLFLLIGVGAAAASVGPRLLLFALGGAVMGALFGISGGSIPLEEVLAALCVSGIGLMILWSQRSNRPPSAGVFNGFVSLSLALHGMLHGHEAHGGGSWWVGAVLASALVASLSFVACRRLGPVWIGRMAGLLAITGVILALGPLGALTAGGLG